MGRRCAVVTGWVVARSRHCLFLCVLLVYERLHFLVCHHLGFATSQSLALPCLRQLGNTV